MFLELQKLKIFKRKDPILYILLICLVIFVIAAILGFFTIGLDIDIGTWNFETNARDYKYFPITLYSWLILGYVFVPIIAFFFLILLPLTIAYSKGKLYFIKIHKLMSAIDYFAISGCSIAQALNMYYAWVFSYIGLIVNVLFWLLAVISLFAGVICIIQFFAIWKVDVSKTKTGKQETPAEKLRTLKKLFEEKVITEEEYNQQKKKYVDLL